PDTSTPDVYYLIYDKYASNEVLDEYYGYDNSSFHEQLEERGFYVSASSRTNYPRTIFSLASSLNMEYIQELVDVDDPSVSEGESLKWLLSYNSVGQIFQRMG